MHLLTATGVAVSRVGPAGLPVWGQALVLGLAVGAAAYTVSSTDVTKGLRAAVAARSLWLGKLLACPYCLAHWLAFGAVALYRPMLVHGSTAWGPLVVVDFLVSSFALMPVAMLAVVVVKAALGRLVPPAVPAPLRSGKQVSRSAP